MKKWVNWSIFAVVGLILAVGVLLFHSFLFPIAIRYQVTKTLELVNGTDAWDRFVVTPIPLILKVYFFRLDNPDGVLSGEKPKVTQVGPYVYREHWEKVDIRIDEEMDRVFYRQKVEYTFDQELSGGLSETDNVTIINPIIHMISGIIDGFPTLNLTNQILEFGLPEIIRGYYGPSLTATVRELLLDGLRIQCSIKGLSFTAKLFCSSLTHFLPLPNVELAPNGDLISSVLKFKELSPLLEMKRGVKVPEELGKIVSMDGERHLGSWWCDSANVVDGFDMTTIAPFLAKTTLPLFVYDLRTTMEMVYREDIEFSGIPGYRFVMSPDLLGDPATNEGARCYCPGSAKNLTAPRQCMEGHGVVDTSSVFGVPLILSNPHFYGASKNYKSMIDGIHPEQKLHESFVDIEPTTGIPLNGKRRIQANVNARKNTAIRLLNKHTDAVIPMIWIDEGAALGDKEISMLKDQLLLVLNTENIARWSLFAVGLIFFAVGLIMAVIRRRQGVSGLFNLGED